MKMKIKGKDLLIKMASIGLNRSGLSKEIGVSKQVVGQYINGITNPSPKIAVKICSILNCDFEDLFYAED